MTLTRLIGDIHGLVNDYKVYAIGDFAGPTIQLGDFGIGFGQSDYWHESINDYHTVGKHRFIRGNHDNPEQCMQMSGCINDGNIEDDVMFIGGAWSIDNPVAPPGWYRRTAGVDWWFDEGSHQSPQDVPGLVYLQYAIIVSIGNKEAVPYTNVHRRYLTEPGWLAIHHLIEASRNVVSIHGHLLAEIRIQLNNLPVRRIYVVADVGQ